MVGISTNQYKDSKSFKPLLTTNNSSGRSYQYSELADGVNDLWTINNGLYKLLLSDDGNEEMYDLTIDPYEQNNILNQILTPVEINAKIELESELNNIRQ